MKYLIVVVVMMAILAAVVGALKQRRSGQQSKGHSSEDDATNDVPPFKRNKHFFSIAEQSFYGCLKQVVGVRFELFAKVRLVDILWLPPGAEGKQGWRNKVQSKHVDFLLCDSKTLLPMLVIELDDSSHNRSDRQDRDTFIDNVLEKAGLPMLRVKTRVSYDTRLLNDEIARLLP